MSVEFFIVFVCSILSLLYGGFTIKKILEEPQGSDRMKEIASAIQEGAQAYLNRQYLTISVVGILIALILFYLMENPFVSIGFVIGAFLSGLAGYIGMFVSVRANVRTTEAATESLEKATSKKKLQEQTAGKADLDKARQLAKEAEERASKLQAKLEEQANKDKNVGFFLDVN